MAYAGIHWLYEPEKLKIYFFETVRLWILSRRQQKQYEIAPERYEKRLYIQMVIRVCYKLVDAM